MPVPHDIFPITHDFSIIQVGEGDQRHRHRYGRHSYHQLGWNTCPSLIRWRPRSRGLDCRCCRFAQGLHMRLPMPSRTVLRHGELAMYPMHDWDLFYRHGSDIHRDLSASLQCWLLLARVFGILVHRDLHRLPSWDILYCSRGWCMHPMPCWDLFGCSGGHLDLGLRRCMCIWFLLDSKRSHVIYFLVHDMRVIRVDFSAGDGWQLRLSHHRDENKVCVCVFVKSVFAFIRVRLCDFFIANTQALNL